MKKKLEKKEPRVSRQRPLYSNSKIPNATSYRSDGAQVVYIPVKNTRHKVWKEEEIHDKSKL